MQKTQSLLVDIDEIKKASTPDRLRTSILFPCIGIIIYQTEQKIALAGHFIDPSIYGMDELIKIAKAELTDPSQQKIYIGGGSPTPDDDPGNVSDQARKNMLIKA
jgi:chemotaxis receptor (MCP) glutamine deamidase CheD